MHLGDGIIIFVIALILFGPKKLPEMARQVAKLMAEFRRASNEFKTQIDEELRSAEQADRQKQISAAAAAPVAGEPTILPPSVGAPVSQYGYSDPAETQRPDRSLDSESRASEGLTSTEETPPTANEGGLSDIRLADSGEFSETSDGSAHVGPPDSSNLDSGNLSNLDNSDLNAGQSPGLRSLFTDGKPTFGAPYLPDAATVASSGTVDTAMARAETPDGKSSDESVELVEGSEAEQAQASVHHV